MNARAVRSTWRILGIVAALGTLACDQSPVAPTPPQVIAFSDVSGTYTLTETRPCFQPPLTGPVTFIYPGSWTLTQVGPDVTGTYRGTNGIYSGTGTLRGTATRGSSTITVTALTIQAQFQPDVATTVSATGSLALQNDSLTGSMSGDWTLFNPLAVGFGSERCTAPGFQFVFTKGAQTPTGPTLPPPISLTWNYDITVTATGPVGCTRFVAGPWDHHTWPNVPVTQVGNVVTADFDAGFTNVINAVHLAGTVQGNTVVFTTASLAFTIPLLRSSANGTATAVVADTAPSTHGTRQVNGTLSGRYFGTEGLVQVEVDCNAPNHVFTMTPAKP